MISATIRRRLFLTAMSVATLLLLAQPVFAGGRVP